MKKALTIFKQAVKEICVSPWFPYAVILSATLIAFIKGIRAPFTLDDFSSIEDNSAIQNLGNIEAIWRFYTNRFIVYLTFAVNYAIHGTSVTGYHIVNILIHYINGILVFLLIKKLLENKGLNKNIPSKYHTLISLLASLLFVCHPMQVNAVTYVVQRTAALASLFYILSVYAYILFRTKEKIIYFFICTISMLAAMFTKENTITLPFMILLVEFIFFNKFKNMDKKRALTVILILMISVLIIPSTNIIFNGYNQSDPQNTFKASTSMNRFHYFYTQQNVIVTYIRQFFVPDNLCFDYSNHIPISKSLFENKVWQSMLVLVLIAISGFAALFFNKLIAFGIAWFFITLSVESSFISIKDVYFEHRMYSPIIGIVIFLTGIFLGWPRISSAWKSLLKSYTVVMLIMIVSYMPVTIYRNYIFSDSIRLWADVVKKAPKSSRAHSVLATSYLNEYEFNGMDPINLEKAEYEFKESLRLDPKNDTSLCNLAKVYLLSERYDECIQTAEKALKVKKSIYAYHHIGQAYRYKKEFAKSEEALLKGFDLDNNSSFILEALGDMYFDSKDFKNAKKYYELFLETYYGPTVEEKLNSITFEENT